MTETFKPDWQLADRVDDDALCEGEPHFDASFPLGTMGTSTEDDGTVGWCAFFDHLLEGSAGSDDEARAAAVKAVIDRLELALVEMGAPRLNRGACHHILNIAAAHGTGASVERLEFHESRETATAGERALLEILRTAVARMANEQPPPAALEPLSKEECLQVQHQVVLIARLVRDLPLEAFLHTLAANRAQALPPFSDPELWALACRKLAGAQRLAEGLQAFKRSVPSLAELLELDHVEAKASESAGR